MSSKNNKELPEKDSSPGGLLRSARKKKQLSVREIADSLRLGVDVIEALERDDFDKLPAPIFVRGYIRSYTVLVGLQEQRVIKCYDEVVGYEEPAVSLSPKRMHDMGGVSETSRWRAWLPYVTILLIVLLGVLVWLSLQDTSQSEQAIPNENTVSVMPSDTNDQVTVPDMAPGQLALPAEPPGDESSGQSQVVPDAPTQNGQQSESIDVPPEPEQQPVVAAQPEVEAPVVEPPPPGPATDNARLTLEFSGNSWLAVTDASGDRLAYRLVKAGERLRLAGVPPFKLTIGDATVTKLRYNDQPIELAPYTRGKMAKFNLDNSVVQ